ncbi:hypothetical protein [Catenuloplanes indicus]|uniref:LigA protein n=1 Tax=Catenuloplanes indicus TaxID=137267 RepID=A0AAE3VWT4_9ACTN|nr:hypothetical protein [Catenuloplanes indicus]MDQ0365184.1 hypothetical protein [Catenuloplanes indicus]
MELLGNDTAPFLDALTRLAAKGGNADTVTDLLDDEDYSYPCGTVDEGFGYRDAAVPALVFLARIVAQPGAIVREDVIELIDRIAHSEVQRAGRSGAEMDARVDGLRAALIEARPALAEAARHPSELAPVIVRLLAGIDAGILPGGADEPRWRGVALPFLRTVSSQLTAHGDLLAVNEETQVVFHSAADGTVVAALTFPNPAHHQRVRVSPPSGEVRLPVRWSEAFIDDQGPGVLVAEQRSPRAWLWRLDGDRWRPIRLIRPGRSLRPSARRVRAMAAGGGECVIGYGDGMIARFDSHTGVSVGPPLTLGKTVHSLDLSTGVGRVAAVLRLGLIPDVTTGLRVKEHVWEKPAFYTADGHARIAAITGVNGRSEIRRYDVATGEEVGSPIVAERPAALCIYQWQGRDRLAVAAYRQVLRFDAETGEPLGPPLHGHRPQLRDIAAGVVDGRPVLFSLDIHASRERAATVRRWDAETGEPFPAE